MKITLHKSNRQIKTEISLPASKSISNRVLIIQHLCPNAFEINNLSTSDDTQLLKRLLATIKETKKGTVTLDAENAGTVFRFLTALCSTIPGEWILSGSDRMHQRPVQPMVDSLVALGAKISYAEKENYPPLKISGTQLNSEAVKIDASMSSQFVSALLLIAPSIESGMKLQTSNETSSHYIRMTCELMKHFGIDVNQEQNMYHVRPGSYLHKDIYIEGDWSAASYWYEMAALADKAEIFLSGLRPESLQGDSEIATHMKHFGVESEFHSKGVLLIKRKHENTYLSNFNLMHTPDLAPALIACTGALRYEATFSGIQNLRVKETDRILTLQQELKKVGVLLNDSKPDSLSLEYQPPVKNEFIQFDSHQDHRIAMAMAPLALFQEKISISGAEAVSKSYPGFWNDLEKSGFRVDQ